MAANEDASHWRNLLINQLNDDCKLGGKLVSGYPKQEVGVRLSHATPYICGFDVLVQLAGLILPLY